MFRDELRQRQRVVVQEVGGHTFLEFDGNLLNLEELAKYRKVYIASNVIYIYAYIVPGTLVESRL